MIHYNGISLFKYTNVLFILFNANLNVKLVLCDRHLFVATKTSYRRVVLSIKLTD